MDAKKLSAKKASYVSAEAARLFHDGTSSAAHALFGAHRTGDAQVFCLYAPNASAVSVCICRDADNIDELPMQRVDKRGIWELCVDARTVSPGDLYRYRIACKDEDFFKLDPYGTSVKTAPDGKPATELSDLTYPWRDAGWLSYRRAQQEHGGPLHNPLNIYEFHVDTCLRCDTGDPLPCEAYARELSSYVKQMGYTHVSLMPIWEHERGTDGYRSISCFAPARRYGTPTDWMSFVDSMHEAGIGVILHWSPDAFAPSSFGLTRFDDTPLFDASNAGRFDLTLPAVQSFLLSNAVYWAETYHADGLHIDPSVYHANDRKAVSSFLKKLTDHFAKAHPDVMIIAGDAARASAPSLRIDNSWAEETLAYFQKDPIWRKYEHGRLTLPLSYAFSDRYLLSISHTNVGSKRPGLLDGMPGDYAQKFANARLLLAFIMTRPGKKQIFSGCEFGQFRAWSPTEPVEWFLTDFDSHAALQQYAAELNHFYLKNPPLWELDGDRNGFAWIDADNADESILSYRRMDKDGNELIVLLNLTPVAREDHLLAVPSEGVYEEVFNSDAKAFGGSGKQNAGIFATVSANLLGYQNAIRITLPPLSALIFKKK